MSVEQFRPDLSSGGAEASRTMPALATELSDNAGILQKPLRGRARERTKRPVPGPGRIVLNMLFVLVMLALIVASAGLYMLDRSYQGRIYPNVTVQGLNVGELTPQEAEAALRARYGAFTSRPATLTYAGKTWQPSLAELGVAFDFETAIGSAYRAGRGNGLAANVLAVAAIWRDGLELPLQVSFDQSRTQAYLTAIATELEQAPADAQIGLNGAQVWTRPSHTGLQVLVDPTLHELTAGFARFQSTSVELQTRTLPPRLNDDATNTARQELETILQAPVTMTFGDQQYRWSQEELARLLTISRIPGTDTDRLAITVAEQPIDTWLTKLADQTEKPSTLPRVDWNGGDLQITKPGVPGSRLDETRAREMFLASLRGAERQLALPSRLVDPPVTAANLKQIGIDELVSVGTSDFSGSAGYRIHNIGAGMRLLQGILLAPGAEFSFNKNIGTIDAANGFVEGAAIIQNRTQQEFGGGICQDSTTLFRAAFWAGLPITERWGHSFYISWYDKYALGPLGNGPGLDATIFTSGPDLKFVNDTGAWMLIQAWSNPKTGVAQVELYGTTPKRTVTLTQRVYDRKPAPVNPVFVADGKVPQGSVKHTDKARGGMTIDVYRIVTEHGVQKAPELFRTRFRAWPNIYTLNPVDLGPDGQPLISLQGPPDPNVQPQPTDPNAQPVVPPLPTDPNAQPQPVVPPLPTGD